MKTLLFLAAVLFGSVAWAEPQQSQFVPFTVQEADIKQLDDILLNNAPRNYGTLFQQWLQSLEQRAIAESRAKRKAEPDAKPE